MLFLLIQIVLSTGPFSNECSETLARLERQLLIAPEFTVTDENIDQISEPQLLRSPRHFPPLSASLYNIETRGAVARLKKILPFPEKATEKIIQAARLAKGPDETVLLKTSRESMHFVHQDFVRHSMFLTFVYPGNPQNLWMVVDEGAVEFTQNPMFFSQMEQFWKPLVDRVFAADFYGSVGWATGGGGTHLNFGANSVAEMEKLLPRRVIDRLFKLLYFRPEIVMALDEFGEHSDARFPLWRESPEFIQDIFEARMMPRDEEDLTQVDYVHWANAYDHNHFVSLKNLEKFRPSIEIRFHRSISSYDELKSLVRFWLHTFSYLGHHEPSKGAFAYTRPDRIPVEEAKKGFIDWMNLVELPLKDQKNLLHLGGVNIFQSIPVRRGPKNLGVNAVPTSIGARNRLYFYDRNRKPLKLNGKLDHHFFINYESFEPRSYEIEFEDGDWGLLSIYPKLDQFPFLTWTPHKAVKNSSDGDSKSLLYFFPSNTDELISMAREGYPGLKAITKEVWDSHLKRAILRSKLVDIYPPHYLSFTSMRARSGLESISVGRVLKESERITVISDPLSSEILRDFAGDYLR